MAAVLLAACLPSFEETPWLIESERVVAVRGVPAEVRPGQAVSLEALVASPDGSVPAAPTWSVCLSPRTADERTGVTAACAHGEELAAIDADAPMIADACSRFGPNPPPSSEGEPPRRPADPDVTGGYFVPVRAETGAAVAFGFERVRCDLPGATRKTFEEYEARYTLNQHPTIDGVTLAVFGNETPLGAAVPRVPAGATIELRVRAAPAAAEPYVVYIAEEGVIDPRLESLTAHFFVSAGVLDRAVVPMSELEATTRLVLPADATARVHGWVIVRDDRGGSSWLEISIDLS